MQLISPLFLNKALGIGMGKHGIDQLQEHTSHFELLLYTILLLYGLTYHLKFVIFS